MGGQLKSQCKNGHPYSPDNVYKNGKSGYRCKQCKKLYLDRLLDGEYEKYEDMRERIRTYQRNHKQKTSERVLMVREHIRALRTKCKYCPETHPSCLDFHHRNPAEKSFNISSSQLGNRSISAIDAEIAKCDVICSNCHRKLHWPLNSKGNG